MWHWHRYDTFDIPMIANGVIWKSLNRFPLFSIHVSSLWLFVIITVPFLISHQNVFAAVSNIEEADGSPSCYGWQLKVSNGTLTDNGDATCSISTGGGGGNSFETIAVPAGASIVADSSTDTATITEDTFLTITGTALTDTLAITQVTTDLGTDGLIAANAVALGTDTTNNYVESVGNCAASEGSVAFGGACGTTLTSTTSEVLDLATDATLIYQRNTAGTVVFTGKDDAGASDTTYDTTTTGNIDIGSADVASIDLLTTGSVTINTSTYDWSYEPTTATVSFGDQGCGGNAVLCVGTVNNGTIESMSGPDAVGLFGSAYGGTYASKTSLAVNNNALFVESEGWNASSGAFDRMGSLYFVADGEFATAGDISDSPGRFEVWTTPDGSSTQALRLTIKNDGVLALAAQATPTTDADGEIALDTDGWGTGFDALELFNGTASAYLVATTATDTPSNGQVPTFNTGGEITWETPAGSGDVTSVGDCVSGACFAGASGTVLTFEGDGGADFTLTYDATTDDDFELSDDLTIEDANNSPHLQLCTTSKTKCVEMYTDAGGRMYLSDVTNSRLFGIFNSTQDHTPSENAMRLRTAVLSCGGTLSTTMDCEDFKTRVPADCTVQRVDLQAGTAPTTQAIIVDVNECNSSGASCTTIDSGTKPQIAASATSGSDTAFTDTVLSQGNFLQFDLDQVGSGTTGSDLTVTVTCLF